MKENGVKQDNLPQLRVHGKEEGASFQIIVLVRIHNNPIVMQTPLCDILILPQGPSGGPREDNVTGLLVRAPQSEWRKGSLIAVDAGAHLAPIIHLLKREMPISSEKVAEPGHTQILEDGPFAGVKFPHISAKANALYVFRELLHSVLITHPHLDHLSAIAINTPALEFGREAKAIVALPSTIDAIKGHIFNDAIWPNLSDEGHGVGFITYRRLIEGGNPRLGSGESRGYISVCDGLTTKCWGVSHGKCHRRNHSISHQRGESFGWAQNDYNFPSRRMSRISDHGYFAAEQMHNAGAYPPAGASAVTPGQHARDPGSAVGSDHMFEPVSSSAFFIRNDITGQEVLIFGDIEPDTVSMYPRNHVVWEDAASKIAIDKLKGIFIECSYDDSTRDADLYGHLCPRHLVAELTFLAKCVISARKQKKLEMQIANGEAMQTLGEEVKMTMHQPPTPAEMRKKRKRTAPGDLMITPELEPTEFASPPSPQALHSNYVGTRSASATRRKTSHHIIDRPTTPASGRGRTVQFQSPVKPADAVAKGENVAAKEKLDQPLKGITVHIIHVKDTLMDGPQQGDVILGQLKKSSAEVGLGVEFDVTSYGESVWV